MMNILYIGQHPTSKMILESNGKIDFLYGSHNALISGLRQLNDVKLKVITSPDIASFPINKSFIKQNFDPFDEALVVSSLNFRFIKQFWTIISIVLAASSVIRNNDHTVVVIPNMVFRHVFAARMLKILYYKKIEICMIIPDIFFPKKIAMKCINNWTEHMACKSEFFVLYTKAMADYLKIRGKPHIIIEGFHNVVSKMIYTPSNRFIITYAGSINIRYGIERLVKALSYIKYKDIELHIYGDGDGTDMVKYYSKIDSRIKFHGKVSKEEATNALFSSSILINPRNATDGEFVQYSFPSKDIDYLASGLPSILCKIPGMPDSYYGYFIDAGNGSAEELASAIKILYNTSKDERLEFGKRAQSFIAARMDTRKQAMEIVEMIIKKRKL